MTPTLHLMKSSTTQSKLKRRASIPLANIFGVDAISTLAIIGRETKTLGLGTAVPPLSTAPGGTGSAGADDCSGMPGAI